MRRLSTGGGAGQSLGSSSLTTRTVMRGVSAESKSNREVVREVVNRELVPEPRVGLAQPRGGLVVHRRGEGDAQGLLFGVVHYPDETSMDLFDVVLLVILIHEMPHLLIWYVMIARVLYTFTD